MGGVSTSLDKDVWGLVWKRTVLSLGSVWPGWDLCRVWLVQLCWGSVRHQGQWPYMLFLLVLGLPPWFSLLCQTKGTVLELDHKCSAASWQR